MAVPIFRMPALIAAFCLFSVPAMAAYIVATTIPTDISACQEVVFEITVTNPAASGQAPGTLQYCLPDGLRFAGATGLTATDTSDLRCPVFDLPALGPNESLTLQLTVQAGCFETDRGDLRDTIRIVSGGMAEPPILGSAYNLRTPVVTLYPGQNWNFTGAVGETFTRTFVLRNEGFGQASMLFVIDPLALAGLELISTTGVLQGDTLFLTGADLGANGFLGYQDSIVVTQMLRLTACAGAAQVISYGWGCPDGTICAFPRFDQYQVSGAGSPAPFLQLSLETPFQAPAPCEPQELSIRIENTGQAVALNLEMLQGLTVAALTTAAESQKSNCYPLSGFRIAGVSLVDLSAGDPYIPYRLSFSALTADPDGPGGLSDEDGDGQFDDLAPGAGATFRALLEFDPACKPCNALQGAFFISNQVLFTSECGGAGQTANLLPNPGLELDFQQSVFSDNLPFILDAGTIYDFQYTIDATFVGLENECPDDSLVLSFRLPPVLGLPPGFQPLFDSLPAPFWTQGDSLMFVLLPGPAGEVLLPVLPVCPPDIDDSAVCAPPYEPRTYQLPADLRWYCGNGCPEAVELVCLGGVHFTIDCPRPPDSSQQHGIFADTFSVRRISMGFADHTLTVQTDPATPGLRLDTGIPYDTVVFQAEARIEGAAGDFFDSSTVQIYYWNGVQPYFEWLSGALLLDDAETGATVLCTGLQPEYEYLNGYHIWAVDLLALTQPGGCLAAAGVQLTPGDRLRLEVAARLTENLPSLQLEEIKDLRVRFPYAYHGDSLLCETGNALFWAINPDYDYLVEIVMPDTVCRELTVGIPFYQGLSGRIMEDIFPYEIRPLYVYDSLWVALDPGYVYRPGSAVWTYFDGDGAAGLPLEQEIALPDPVQATSPAGEDALLFLRPAGLPVTDYYRGRAVAALRFQARALCPPDTTNLPVHIVGRRLIAIRDSVNVNIAPFGFAADDFNELALATASLLSSSRTPIWVVEFCNPGPAMAIETPLLLVENGAVVQLTSVTDITDPLTPLPLPLLPADSGKVWVQGQYLAEGGCRTLEIKADLTGCGLDTLRLTPGFQCSGAAGPCLSPNPLTLYFSPKISLAQINVSTSPDTAVDLCAPLDYAITVINVGDGELYDLTVSLQLPFAGQTLIAGSSAVEYAGQVVALPDPAQGPGGLVWTLDFSQLPFGIEGLPGILFAQANALTLHFQLETDCDYLDGTRFLYGCSWRDACGDEKFTTPFVAPPLSIEGAPVSSNAYEISVTVENPASFCAENTVRLNIFNPGNLGATQVNEKVRIRMPAGFEYVAGSLQPVHNGPAQGPAVLPFGNSTYLSFDLPAGVSGGDSVVFNFRLLNTDPVAGCITPYEFSVEMTQTVDVACLNDFCAVDFVLIERAFATVLQKPGFALAALNGTGLPLDAGLEEWQIDFAVQNLSGIPGGGNLQLEIRLDENQNAQLDPADPVLLSFAVNADGLAPGEIRQFVQTVEVAATRGCSGLWLLLTDTLCSCTQDSLFLPFIPLTNSGGDQTVCAGASVMLGFPPLNNAAYQWITPSLYLSGTNLSNPEYRYTGAFDASLQFLETLVLQTTRAQGCISFDTLQIVTRKISLALAPAPVLCYGDSTGTVIPSVQGAADPASFVWSNGDTLGGALTQLPAGVYALTVTDAFGCTAGAVAEVTEPPLLTLQLLVSDYNGFGISCAGASDGHLSAQVSGGAGGYQFDWLPAGAGANLTSLPPGVYSLTLTDANGCTRVADTSLTEPAPLTLTLTVADEVCRDAQNGAIAVAVQGGATPYYSEGYQVSNIFFLDSLNGGAYRIVVADANGCTVSADTTVVAHFSEFSSLSDSVTCFGGADGYAEINGAGFPPFSFVWSTGDTAPFIIAGAGQYTCTVTDDLGCVYVLETAISQPLPLSLSALTTPADCFGDSSGRVALVAEGGSLPYTFYLNGQVVQSPATNLPAGQYAFVVEDAKGCSAGAPATIGEPSALTLSLTSEDAVCFGSATGSASALAAGGTAPYTVSWSNGLADFLLDPVAAGTYTVTLTDALGCTLSDSVMVDQPEPYEPVYEALQLPCADRANGVLAVSGFPDGSRYGLNRTPNQAEPVFSGVGGGPLVVQVEDPLGCLFSFAYEMPSLPDTLGIVLADTVMRLGDSAWLRIVLPPDSALFGGISYQWVNPVAVLSGCDTCPSLWVRPFRSTYYIARFTSTAGCSSESRVLVQVIRDDIYAPNALHPEAVLEENRAFTLYGRTSSVREVRFLRIFDRWGEAVFERTNFQPNDPALGWDGRFRSEAALPGVYVWYAEVEFIDGSVLPVKGDVTVVR